MYLAFDLGATKLRISSSEDGKDLVNTKIFDTPNSTEELLKLFADYQSGSDVDLKFVAGCLPGGLDASKSQNTFNLNIPYLENFPLREKLQEILGCSVILENDAMCSGLGEAVYGSGKGKNIVAYLTISSGVGGARIVGGKIDDNSMGFEPGYQVIDFNGSYDKNFLARDKKYPNNYGYLQRLVSGEDIETRVGKSSSELEDESLWEEITRIVAFGVNNTIVYWSPDVIVLGGAVARNRIVIEKLREHVKEIAFNYSNIPEIKLASLEDKAGLYGALTVLNSLTS